MKQKSLKANTLYSIIKSVSAIVFPLISFPYASRMLLTEGIGKVNFGMSVVSYFSLLATLGLTTYAIRECSRVREDKKVLSFVGSQLLSINLLTTLISYLLLGLTLIFARPLEEYRLLIVVQSSAILFTTTGADWLNSAMEDFRFITLRTVFFQLLSLVLMFLFVRSPEDYLIYALITVLSSSGANIVNIFYRRRYCTLKPTCTLDLKRHMPPILLLFVMQLSQIVFVNADITMLGLIHGDHEVGLYSTAVKVYNIVSQLISSILWVVMPRLSLYYVNHNYEKINPLLRKILSFSLALGLPCVAGLNALAPEIIQIIGGEEYLAAAPALQILSVSLFFSLIGGSFIGNIILLPSKREKYYMIVCSIAAVVNVVLNALLIPAWGIYAAAGTTAFTALLIFALLLPKVERQIRLGNLWSLAFAPLLGSALILLTGFLIKPLLPGLWTRTLVVMAISVAVYGAVMLLCRYELVWNILGGILRKIKKER